MEGLNKHLEADETLWAVAAAAQVTWVRKMAKAEAEVIVERMVQKPAMPCARERWP
jgi:hypothetical protein